MKTQEIRERRPGEFGPGQQARRPVRGSADGMGLRAALLGVVCVAGVFAMLGLLYTFG